MRGTSIEHKRDDKTERHRGQDGLSSLDVHAAIGWIGQAFLLAPVLVLPWFFGGVRASAQVWLCVAVFAGTACVLLRCLTKESDSSRIPWLMVPLVLALCLGAFQQVDLPVELHRWLGTESYRLWTELMPDQVASQSLASLDVGGEPANHRPLSLYPASTRRDLILLAVGVALLFAASQFDGHSLPVVATLCLVAANGAALAFFGIAQQLQWNGMLYGSVPLTQGGTPFASFVNRNHAAGFLNLSLAAAIGMCIWSFSPTNRHAKRSNRDDDHSTPSSSPRSTSLRRWLDQGLMFVGNLDGKKAFSLSAVVLIVAGLVCSLSRGGWIAAAIAAVITVWLASSTKAARVWAALLLVAALSAFGLVDWLGRTELVQQRFATLFDQSNSPDGRLAHWQDGLASVPGFWLMGSGLGTYRYVYPMYQTKFEDTWFYHAENQYLEALVEGGIIGLGLMLGAVGLAGFAAWKLLSATTDPLTYACGVAGTFAIVSQAVHSFFDFGLYLPANMGLLALICGVICGRSALAHRAHHCHHQHEDRSGTWPTFRLPSLRALSAPLATVFLIAVGVGYAETSQAAIVEDASLHKRLMTARPHEITVDDATFAIRELTNALRNDVGSAESHLNLAELWILRSRLVFWNALRAQNPGSSVDALWQMTAPLALHGTVCRLEAERRFYDLESTRRADYVQIDLRNAARHLVRALEGAPVLPKPHLLLAEIAPVLDANANVGDLFAHVSLLAGGNYPLLRESAIAQLQAGRVDSGLATFGRVVAIAPEELGLCLELGSEFAEPSVVVPAMTAGIAPRSPSLLIELSHTRFSNDKFSAMRYSLMSRAKELVESETRLDESERAYVRGAVFLFEKDEDRAREWMVKAVAGRPEKVAWRYELASLLQKQGRLSQAKEHARICVRMEPKNERFDAFLKELNRVRDR